MTDLRKAVRFSRTGHPPDVVELVDMPTPPPAAGEVVIDVEAAAINPSHLLTLAGKYGVQPELPAVPGAEGIGIVSATGDGVTGVALGDRVMIPPYAGTWRQQVVVPADRVQVVFPAEGDPVQMAMLMANPPTAWLLLSVVDDLAAGDWVIQNAANSAVGQYLMQLARIRGLRTVNVVRRDGLEPLVAEAGGDVCIVDGDDLAARVREATGGAPLRLAVDAVAGNATQRLADCLADGGTIANYGLLSGEPCRLSPSDIIFRDIRLRGVWLTRWLASESTPEQRRAVYGELAGYIAAGRMHARVDATYPLSQIREAVSHAMRDSRDGKIVILPNADG